MRLAPGRSSAEVCACACLHALCCVVLCVHCACVLHGYCVCVARGIARDLWRRVREILNGGGGGGGSDALVLGGAKGSWDPSTARGPAVF